MPHSWTSSWCLVGLYTADGKNKDGTYPLVEAQEYEEGWLQLSGSQVGKSEELRQIAMEVSLLLMRRFISLSYSLVSTYLWVLTRVSHVHLREMS